MTVTTSPGALAPPAPLASGQARGVLFAIVGALFWSLSGLLVRLTEEAGSWQIVFYRSAAMTATLLLVLILRYGWDLRRPMRQAGADALLAGAALTGASIFFILSLGYVTVANALFMCGIAPFLAALLARLWLGEPVAGWTWVGMAVAAFGVLVMVQGSLAFDGLTGNLLALGSAVSFALVSVSLRRGRQVDMAPAILLSGVLSGLLSGLVLLAVAGGSVTAAFALGPRDLALCAAMGTVQLGLGTICYAVAARHLPAAALQLLALSELVMSPLWVWLAVAEIPAASTLLGGALIMAATLLQVVVTTRAPAA